MNSNDSLTPSGDGTIQALPFVFDEKNEQIVSLLEQVAGYCGTVFDEDPEKALAEKKAYWVKLWQVIRFISNITCWTEQADDTFITQTRIQNFSIDQICACRPGCCHCDEDEIDIPLEFFPLAGDEPFISGKITVFINGEPKVEEVTAEYLNKHFDAGTNKLHLIRTDFPETLLYKGKCCCLCRRKATVTLKYNAGYNLIPTGLLPMICPLINKLSNLNLSECANAMTEVSGALKFKKVGNIQYQWSDVETSSMKTQTLYTELFNLATVDEIYAISRCLIAETPEEMGEVI